MLFSVDFYCYSKLSEKLMKNVLMNYVFIKNELIV